MTPPFSNNFSQFEKQHSSQLRALQLLTAICSSSCNDPSERSSFLFIILELMFQLVGPIGLLGNLASIISIADHWRSFSNSNNTVVDTVYIYVLNSIALSLGCAANLVLLMHMELKMEHHLAVLLTSCLFVSACIVYCIMLALTEFFYFNNGIYSRTIGYWQAACGTVLYFVCAIITTMYAVRTRNEKWNISTSKRQRLVTLLCYLYFFWIAGGAAIFHLNALGLYVEYAQSVYFVVVSCLTLGFGDIVTTTTLGKMLVIPLIYIGILIGGWVAYVVFNGNLYKAHNVVVDMGVEQLRLKVKDDLNEMESFNQMRAIVQKVQLRDQFWHACITSIWLITFLLCGALIFHFTESWAYSDAFYMCAISLVEVGYGDFVPKSSGGRALFIHYVLVALPSTAAAVSDLGAFLALMVKKYANSFTIRSLKKLLREKIPKSVKQKLTNSTFENVKVIQMHETSTKPTGLYIDEVQRNFEKDSPLQDAIALAKWDQNNFDYEVWRRVMCNLLGVSELPGMFWVSEYSPIRHASLDERKFLTMAVLHTQTRHTQSHTKSHTNEVST